MAAPILGIARAALHRYCAEYEFRYNHRIANGFDDRQCGTVALEGISGKRLTYRTALIRARITSASKSGGKVISVGVVSRAVKVPK